jgi:hypothetical protein
VERLQMTMIYPLVEGRAYTIGELKETEATLLKERQADQVLSAKLRTQKGRDIPWAKSRAEEAYAIMLFARQTSVDDGATFTFDPAAVADFEIASQGRIIKLQCTMAYEKRRGRDTGGKRFIRQMTEYNRQVLEGGPPSFEVNDGVERLNNWRAGIADAIAAKVAKEKYAGHDLSLLVYARGCAWENIDTRFIDIAEPAIATVDNWQSVVKSVYVVDDRECACFG